VVAEHDGEGSFYTGSRMLKRFSAAKKLSKVGYKNGGFSEI